MDVHIIIDHDKDNVTNLLECLQNFGEGSSKELTVDDFILEEGCIRIVENFPLDIFTLMVGNTYQDLIPYIKIFETDAGIDIPFLNSKGLIKLKSNSSSPKDQIDVNELKKLKD